MNPQKQNRKRLLLKAGAVFFAVTLLLSTGLLLVSQWERHFGADESDAPVMEECITYNGQDYVLRQDVETLLELGLDTFENADSASYRNDKQADFLMLLVLDKKDNSCKAIQINRDTMVEMDVLGVAGDRVGTTTGQLALSHTYGNGREVSCRNTANAVAKLLGVDVRHFVSVSMSAVPLYNDLVGGVTLEVMDDFTSVDPAMVQGQTVTLTGQQALYYVRSRYGLDDPTNQQRMQRQKQYLQGLLDATGRCIQEDKSFVASAIQQMDAYWVSDCPATQLEDMMTRYTANQPKAVHAIQGTTQVGEAFLEFYPDEESIRQIVVECFYEPVQSEG